MVEHSTVSSTYYWYCTGITAGVCSSWCSPNFSIRGPEEEERGPHNMTFADLYLGRYSSGLYVPSLASAVAWELVSWWEGCLLLHWRLFMG